MRTSNPTRNSVCSRGSLNYVFVITAGLLLTRGLFLLCLPEQVASVDLRSWVKIQEMLNRGENPYRVSTFLNWPPLWMQLLYLLGRIARYLSVSSELVIRFFLMVVEWGTAMTTFALMRLCGIEPKTVCRYVLVGIVLNPVALLLTCQHSNFDGLVALFIVLSIVSFLIFVHSAQEPHWLLSCLFLGLGVLAKTVPATLIPLLFSKARGVSTTTKWIGLFLLLAPVTLGLSIIYVLSPSEVTEHVIRYSSAAGFFGLTGLLPILGVALDERIYKVFFISALLSVILLTGRRLWRSPAKQPAEIILVALLVLLFIPTLGPGYGPQYLAWSIPLLVSSYPLFSRVWRRGVCSVYVVAALTYILEYGLIESHGGFMLVLFDSPQIRSWADLLSSPSGQTLLRLPLFGALLALLWQGWQILQSAEIRKGLKGA